MSTSPYMLVADVAERLHVAPSTVHEWARTGGIPHRKLAGSRRLLFLPSDLEAWEAGASLELVELPRGGRIVRPDRHVNEVGLIRADGELEAVSASTWRWRTRRGWR